MERIENEEQLKEELTEIEMKYPEAHRYLKGLVADEMKIIKLLEVMKNDYRSGGNMIRTYIIKYTEILK